MRTKRKGFAIVLVAALAGLIFLLGATLVVLARLQSASANYDQRVRLAREHARAALDMAVADLQDKLGKDIAVSFTADTQSAALAEDFKDERVGAVREPYWTGASDGNTTSWLVTQALNGTTALPTGAAPSDEVELLGEGTVGANDLLRVKVPTEAISMKGVDGFAADSARTIGNYAYWVGDLGVKASYAWYDQIDSVSHEPYVIAEDEGEEIYFAQNRLRQATISKPGLRENQNPEPGSPSWEDVVDSDDPVNSARIDSFVNDFQFRHRFGGSGTDERFLVGLDSSDAEYYFHDFTALSKGMMVNSSLGGFRLDLSLLEPASDAIYIQAYKAYSNFYAAELASYEDFDAYTYRLRGSSLGVLPVLPAISQFNLNYSISFSSVIAGPSELSISVEATLELWNPYASAIEFGEGELEIIVDGLPEVLAIWLNDGNSEGGPDFVLKDGNLPSALTFKISSISNGSKRMRAGQIVLLSGPLGDGSGGVVYELKSGGTGLTRGIVYSSTVELVAPLTHFYAKSGLVEDPSTIGINVKLRDGGTDLLTYNPQGFSLSKTLFENPMAVTPPRFGFSWEFKDLSFPIVDTTQLFNPSLGSSVLNAWEPNAAAEVNVDPVFPTSGSALFGAAATVDASESDFPLIKLPKQAFTNVGQLSVATGVRRDPVVPSIGEADVSTNQNRFFDQYYFSGIPKGITNWKFGDSLPNAIYKPRAGISGFSTDSGEEIFVHGLFNVHSTSVDSWAALLRGAPVEKHPYWKDILPNDTYLFMNHPLGGEDINVVVDEASAPDVDSLDAIRLSLKKNAFALSEEQVDALAELIVEKIRGRVGDDPVNPFDSLEEFVNSGVLQDAIDALDEHVDPSLRINPSWVIAGTPAEFRQSTILNLISGILSVRSDTFLVRAYGDAVDPADPSKVWARAYCEAIVQRTHEEYNGPAASLADTERKFEVVAFRWLSPAEI
ncbi:hypothetical protein [Pelagicoccus sp. SDUM812005]|uniref:hypothetical protein n=1 Tax=Pelagicoccus sp. SDUM812005 TaxID=3041257 RepID=UPI00280E2CCE|nr:hypothetical protein [Pelagicoccus sp. SDUM812005]MDQ8182463.1 hypothetical protein [Pelagicoccus sp. SDUM812005]